MWDCLDQDSLIEFNTSLSQDFHECLYALLGGSSLVNAGLNDGSANVFSDKGSIEGSWIPTLRLHGDYSKR